MPAKPPATTARPQRNLACANLECRAPQKPSASPTGVPRQSTNATSCGNLSRASLIKAPELERASIGRTPAGTTIHSKVARARPQIKPAPGLVARLAKNKPKANPKRAPHEIVCTSEPDKRKPC